MTDEGKSLKELSQRMERLVYIISSTTCPLEPGLGVGVSQAALGVRGSTLLPLCPAPVSAPATPLPSPALLDPCWGEAQGWWGRCSWEDANSAQGGEAGPGSVPPGRSAPRPCLHNWLVTLDKPETSHSLLGNGFCRVKPRLEHGTQLALNNRRPWEALCGTWAIHTTHWLSTTPGETTVKSNDHFCFPYGTQGPSTLFFFLCGLSLSLEFQLHRDPAPGKHPAHIWGALRVYCIAAQDHALSGMFTWASLGSLTKPGRAVLLFPFPGGGN